MSATSFFPTTDDCHSKERRKIERRKERKIERKTEKQKERKTENRNVFRLKQLNDTSRHSRCVSSSLLLETKIFLF